MFRSLVLATGIALFASFSAPSFAGDGCSITLKITNTSKGRDVRVRLDKSEVRCGEGWAPLSDDKEGILIQKNGGAISRGITLNRMCDACEKRDFKFFYERVGTDNTSFEQFNNVKIGKGGMTLNFDLVVAAN